MLFSRYLFFFFLNHCLIYKLVICAINTLLMCILIIAKITITSVSHMKKLNIYKLAICAINTLLSKGVLIKVYQQRDGDHLK